MRTILRIGLILFAAVVVAGVAWLAVDNLGSGMAMPDRPVAVVDEQGEFTSTMLGATESAESESAAQSGVATFPEGGERGERGERPGGGLMAVVGVIKNLMEMVLVTAIVVAATLMWERLRRQRRRAAAVA